MEVTLKYKNRYRILKLLSILVNISPILVYTFIAFTSGTVSQKTTLGLTLVVCVLFTITNLVFKYHIRSTIWILLIGIHICLNNITSLLVIIAIATMTDEFILSPLAKKYKQKYVINNEIDKRS